MIFLLSGCLSPRTPTEKCTVLFEDHEGLYFSRQVCTVERFGQVSVTVGVPKGQRIASVNYGNYSVSAKVEHSENFDYYILTLNQIRYSTLIRLTTAEAYTTTYHPGLGTGEAITVSEESPHLYCNTLPYRQQFSREGYAPIGWNTQPDGSGISVGFGSRIDHREASHLDLYMQWLPCTPAAEFSYSIQDGQVTITGCRSSGDVVIPAELEGFPVTAIAAGAFQDLQLDTLVLPESLRLVEAGAFSQVSVQTLYFFDSILKLNENSFADCAITSIHIQAVRDPAYSGSYFDTFADKMDYLDSLRDSKKLILFCGSSGRFGYDSTMLQQALPDYRVVNMGVYAYANMRPQAELILALAREGDILLSSPELDAIEAQFCADPALDKEIFCMVEANYDLFSRLDCRNYTNIFGALRDFLHSRQDMPARSYLESASAYDEDGNPQLTATYNIQGDYILYRPDNEAGKTFGIKRAYYNPKYVTARDIGGLNRVFDAFAEKGVRVLFTYSPRSRISISDDSTPESIQALDALLRRELHATVISPIEDSLMDPLYFYGTDNHLSTNGVKIHTQQVIEYLKATLN